MKAKMFVSLLIAMFFVSGNVFAQSAQDMEVLKQRAKEKVKQLNDYISFMANPQKASKTRYFYKEQAQKLFINDCDRFKEIVEYKDGSKEEVWRDGVTMEVAFLRNRTPRPRPMKEYFRGLITMTYKSVTIETTDIADMRVSKLQPYGKDENGKMMYICSVYFDQAFVGRRGDGGIYKDITHKWVVCYVQVDDVLDEKTGETYPEYMVKLGDVHVGSCRNNIENEIE